MKPPTCVGKIAPVSLCVFWVGLSAPAIGQDVEMFGVVKTREYVQIGSQIVHLNDHDGDEPLKFEAFVEPASGGTVISASVTPPGGSPIGLAQDGSEFGHRYATDWPLDLEEEYPNGDYRMQIQTGGTPIDVTLSLTEELGGSYPNIPRVSNFAAAQAIISPAGFTLTWDPFTTGATGDLIEVRIRDAMDNEIFTSDSPGPGLDDTATNFLIPAATLSPGSHYSAEIVFINVVDHDDSSGATGVAVYITQTIVPMATLGTPSDTDPPWLENSRPFFDETDVPVESVVAFRFNEAMATPLFPKLAWSGAGLTPALFSYYWSTDARRLFAVYGDPAGLPQDTEISWEINPAAGGGITVSDLVGNPLPPQTGSFHTAAAPPSGDPDIESMFLAKTQGLFQDASGVRPSGLFGVEAGAEFNALNALLAGTVTVSGGGTLNLLGEWLGEDTDTEADFTSKAELDQFFPNGSYQVSLNTAHDGMQNVTVDLLTDSYPNNPTVTGIAALQAIDASQPLTITWQSFDGATDTPEFAIWIYISTESGFDVFESDDPGEPEALSGTSTSIIIPAGTLSPGRAYEAELEFVRIVDTDDTSYPDAVFSAAFSKITEFDMQTIGTPIQPRIAIVRSPGSTEIQVVGDRFTSYYLTASKDLDAWHQIQFPMNTWESGELTMFDWDADFFKQRYYRVVENPDPWDSQSQLPVSIQGTVFQAGGMTPVVDALVATSLDGNTALTDDNGSFFLQTDTVRPPDQPPYSLIITKAGFQQFNQLHDWGDNPRHQEFPLQPE